MSILRTRTTILAARERCFDLARSVDVHTAGAALIHGKAIAGRTAGLSELGDRTTWSARFFGMRFSMTTEITDFQPPSGFSDVQRAGLFRHFGHVYTFQPVGVGRTLMLDEFSFQSPFGMAGAVFDAFLLRRRMEAVLANRAHTIKRIAESEEWRDYLQEDTL